jgi:chemotaxis-related protein WspD
MTEPSSQKPVERSTSGALRLLDREPPPDYLRDWTARIAAEKAVADAGTTSAVIFRIGAECLALPTKIFQEVAEHCLMHSLPHRSIAVVAGLVNVRGELLVCASLAVLLDLEPTVEEKKDSARNSARRLLVVNRSGNRLAFPVDEVFGVHRYHPRELRPVPDTLRKTTANYTMGILPWRDRTVGCLDEELLFYMLNKSFA